MARRVVDSAVEGQAVWLDGYNVLTTVEAALAGAVLLADMAEIVATADSAILDRCGPWLNLARQVVETHVGGARILDLASS